MTPPKDSKELREAAGITMNVFDEPNLVIGDKIITLTPEQETEYLKRFDSYAKEFGGRVEQDLLYDLDEIDNKPWRVFRQLAKIMPEYAEEYTRYEAFYSYGGGHKVKQLIEEFEQTDYFKESGFPEHIAQLSQTVSKEVEDE